MDFSRKSMRHKKQVGTAKRHGVGRLTSAFCKLPEARLPEHYVADSFGDLDGSKASEETLAWANSESKWAVMY